MRVGSTARARGEPRFAARLLGIVAFADGLPLVAHNAAFDLGVTRDAADESGIAWPTTTYACTLVIARRTYALLSSSLPGSPRPREYRSPAGCQQAP